MNIKFILSIAATIGLSACGSGYDEYHEDHYGESHPVYSDAPEIVSFNMIDSYEINSEFERDPLRLSPYVDNGLFELFWEIDTRTPHRVEMYLNDRPTTDRGILMSSSWCGAGENCGRNSYQFCRYRGDLTMTCELPESIITYADRNISSLINNLPEQAYFVLEVCDEDLFYCEYSSLRVTLE